MESRQNKAFGEPSFNLHQLQAHDDKYEQVEDEIVEEARPPMITIPEYRKKFRSS